MKTLNPIVVKTFAVVVAAIAIMVAVFRRVLYVEHTDTDERTDYVEHTDTDARTDSLFAHAPRQARHTLSAFHSSCLPVCRTVV
ncbi:MAG: hypothetical protein GY740_25160 [Gammaproteobacteria bacterium]|nr:hypothetical protein [Gammaproteobacteria bacterium]